MILSLRTWLILGAIAAFFVFVVPWWNQLKEGQLPSSSFGPDALFGEDAAGNCILGYWRNPSTGVCQSLGDSVRRLIPDFGRQGV